MRSETSVGVDRRAFLQSMGGGLLIALTLDQALEGQESGSSGRQAGQALPENVAAWLHIAPDSTITAFTGKVEVGQNIRTSLTQAVADELHCQPAKVRMVMGDTSLTPWDAGTFGSRTTPTMAPQLRRMAAAAREALLAEGAKQWGMDRARLQAKDGCVCESASSKQISFGDLAAKIDWVKVVGSGVDVTPPGQWQVAGRSLPKVNAREIVSGAHKYTSDHKRPGVLYGTGAASTQLWRATGIGRYKRGNGDRRSAGGA